MRAPLLIAFLCTASLIAQPAVAETLGDALAKAYRTNATLSTARAQLRGLDAGVALARSQGRPSAQVQSVYSEFEVNRRNSFPTADRAIDTSGQISLPLYLGGGARNSNRAARAQVDAGRQGLRSTEQQVFVDTVTAYMDVIRDLAVVNLNRGLIGVLRVNVDYANAGFRAGDFTRTDIAQAEGRLAQAEGQLRSALAQLDTSRETYLRVVGEPPVALEAPPALQPLPPTPDAAVAVAVDNNPDVLASREQVRVAGYQVRVADSTRLPRLNAFGSATSTNYLNSLGGVAASQFFQRDRSVTGGLQLTLPLYQGGAPSARVRQAQATQSAAFEQATDTERAVIGQTRASFSRYRASQDVIAASERAVAANQRAADGMRAESRAGTRDVILLLNAEQELLNSQVTLVAARRDAYVAGFQVLAAIGRAQASDLGLDPATLYDPEANYRRVAGDVFDWNSDPKPEPVAPRTAGIAMPSVLDVAPATTKGSVLLTEGEAGTTARSQNTIDQPVKAAPAPR